MFGSCQGVLMMTPPAPMQFNKSCPPYYYNSYIQAFNHYFMNTMSHPFQPCSPYMSMPAHHHPASSSVSSLSVNNNNQVSSSKSSSDYAHSKTFSDNVTGEDDSVHSDENLIDSNADNRLEKHDIDTEFVQILKTKLKVKGSDNDVDRFNQVYGLVADPNLLIYNDDSNNNQSDTFDNENSISNNNHHHHELKEENDDLKDSVKEEEEEEDKEENEKEEEEMEENWGDAYFREVSFVTIGDWYPCHIPISNCPFCHKQYILMF